MKDESLSFMSRFIPKATGSQRHTTTKPEIMKKNAEEETSLLLHFSNFFKGPIMYPLQKTLDSKISKKKDGLLYFLGASLTGYYF